VDIFVAWSGEVGGQVAQILKSRLPSILQYVRPFVATEDVHKGQRWLAEVGARLQECTFGIICLTPESLNSPWVHFEAGALSKAIKEAEARVAPFLLAVRKSDLSAPLSQFQATDSTREDVERLVKSINSVAPEGEKLNETRVKEAFEKWWPDLEEELRELASQATSTTTPPPEEEEPALKMLEQVLELLRSLHTKVNRLQRPIPSSMVNRARQYYSRYLANHPEEIEQTLKVLEADEGADDLQPPPQGTSESQSAPDNPKG
jgi:hypothetical protein